MVGQWSWRKKHTYTKVIPGPADKPELKKAIISNVLYDVLVCHIWGLISVTVSIVLFCLHLTEYSIAGEIGGSAGATANFIGTLQLAIKAHEITIVASLYRIAQQWIQGTLIDLNKGIPLGLLGVEHQLGQLSFLYSKSYLSTVRYVVSQWRTNQGRLDLCLLTIFLFAATIVSSLAGPASGVLMIPHPDWFFDSVLNLTGGYKSYDRYTNVHPYIIVSRYIESHRDSRIMDPFHPFGLPETVDSFKYWSTITTSNLNSASVRQNETTYNLVFGDRSMHVNISSTLGRTLDNNNTGRTYAKTVMQSDVQYINRIMSGTDGMFSIAHAKAMLRWSGRKYVVHGNAMTVETNCHYKRKERCPTRIATAYEPNTDWCPQHLVLLCERSRLVPWARDQYLYLSRVYMTEGPRTQKYPQFTDSYQVIFDAGSMMWNGSEALFQNKTFVNILIPTPQVIVCSIRTTIHPAVLTSLAIPFTPAYAEYPSPKNQTILFHERWLDGTNWLRPTFNSSVSSLFPNGNLTLPRRNMSDPTGNSFLRMFGERLVDARDEIFRKPGTKNIPMHLETAVSASFLSVYTYLDMSDSQYPSNLARSLPESLMPETPVYHNATTPTITAYNFGYGFRLYSRTGILGITILIAHAVIVVLGSGWQLFCHRSVISAWDTIPDYVALGLGSVTPPAKVLDNTCAGIAGTKSLQTIVKVGETTELHLEIAAGEQAPGTNLKSVLGKLDVKYGSRDGRAKEKLE